MNLIEIWLPVKIEQNGILHNFTDRYEISNLGRIRNSITKKILKSFIDNKGYLKIRLRHSSNRKTYSFLIHRLVANAFISNFNKLDTVNHIDGNKLNNNVCNLEWCTRSYNSKHAYDNDLFNHNIVENNRKKAVLKVSVKVNQFSKDGIFIRTFNSLTEASKFVGVSGNAIKKCCIGKCKISAGYIWKYA